MNNKPYRDWHTSDERKRLIKAADRAGKVFDRAYDRELARSFEPDCNIPPHVGCNHVQDEGSDLTLMADIGFVIWSVLMLVVGVIIGAIMF